MKPGGHIIIQGSLGEHCYTVGSSMFPAMTADKGSLISEGILIWSNPQKRLQNHYSQLFKIKHEKSWRYWFCNFYWG